MSDAPMIYHYFDANAVVLRKEWQDEPEHIHVHRDLWASAEVREEILEKGYGIGHGDEGDEWLGLTK